MNSGNNTRSGVQVCEVHLKINSTLCGHYFSNKCERWIALLILFSTSLIWKKENLTTPPKTVPICVHMRRWNRLRVAHKAHWQLCVLHYTWTWKIIHLSDMTQQTMTFQLGIYCNQEISLLRTVLRTLLTKSKLPSFSWPCTQAWNRRTALW